MGGEFVRRDGGRDGGKQFCGDEFFKYYIRFIIYYIKREERAE